MDIIKSDIVALHGMGISMQGGRPENQDDWGCLDTPLGFLIIICDGMGGGPGGKTASYIVKHEIASTLCDCAMQTPREHALKMAVARANDALVSKMQEVPALSGMGSTFVAVLINKYSAVIAHAGDSRCYKLRGKKCLYRSEDHSLVAELVKKNALTEEEARVSPQANVIFRGLGSTTNHVPEIEEISFNRGDRFVLCTDGVWGSMPQKILLDKLSAGLDVGIIITNLSSEIDRIGNAKGGGHDNHTLAIFDMASDSLLKEKRKIGKWLFFGLVVLSIVGVLVLLLLLTRKENNPTETVVHIQKEEMPVVVRSETAPTFNETSSKIQQDPVSVTAIEKNSADTQSPADNIKIDATPLTNDSLKHIISNMVGDQKRQEGDTASNKKQVNSKREKESPSKPENIVDNVIKKYVESKGVKGNTAKDAARQLEGLQKEIKTSLEKLRSNVKKDYVEKVEAIERGASNPTLLYVTNDNNPNSRKFVPTRSALKEIKKQIDRLKKLRMEIIKKK